MFSRVHILASGFLLGAVLLILSLFPSVNMLRWIVGVAFVYFFSGYPLGLLFLPKADSWLERLLVSSGFSLLLTYPAGFLNVVREGQSASAIFGYHLSGDIFFLIVAYIVTLSFLYWRKREVFKEKITFKFGLNWLLIFPLALSVFFNFYQLDRADLNGDEYDLGYQAYDLVDGIFAGRKAYTLSFNMHPPLTMYIQHFTMNILEPSGLDHTSDWMFRFGPAILGALTVAITYLLAKETTGNKVLTLFSSSFLAVNNYHVFLSRIFHREAFLAFFLTLFLYFLIRTLKTKASVAVVLPSIFLGAALLVKATAVIFLPLVVYSLYRYISKRFAFLALKFLSTNLLIFSPVLLYNLGAYLTTGYTDIFFSKIFGTKANPGASIVNPDYLANFTSNLSLFIDQYGPLLMIAFLLAMLLAIKYKDILFNSTILIFVLLSVVFFLLTGVKVYYLSFLTVPLVILLGQLLAKIWKKGLIFRVLIPLVFVYSISLTSKTIFDKSFIVSEKYTESYPDLGTNLSKHSSFTTRGFLEDRGWKRLKSELERYYSPTDCLLVDVENHPLQLRRYLGIADRIKEHYLGPLYQPKYKLCNGGFTSGRVWKININDTTVGL